MTKALKFQSITLAILIILNISLFAQQTDSVKTYTLEETVVTGTRFELKQNRLPISVSVINNNEIENSKEVNVLPLVNNSVPGAFVNTRSIMGYGVAAFSSGEISIRGIGESPNTGVLVLVDGQAQYMGIFGHPINDSYLQGNVEKIEVIRGPASLLYGSNALGGAINLITKRQKSQGLSLQTSASYGSFNSSIVSGAGGYRNNDLNVVANFTHSGTDGHRQDGDDNFKSNSVFTQINYNLFPAFNFSLDGNFTDSKFYDPGPESAPRKNNYYDYARGRGALTLENKFASTEGAVKLYYNFGKHDFFDGFYSTDDMKGASVFQSLKFLGENIFTAGVEYKNYGGRAENKNIPMPPKGFNSDLKIDETEAYGIFQVSLLNDLNISAGLRATNNSSYGFEYIPQFGLSYNLSTTTTLKANAGKAFRSPTVADLFLFPISNTTLEPEKIWSYEIGVQQFLVENKIKAELTFFYLDAENVIQVLPSAGGVKKVNSGTFNNKGVEFMIYLLPVSPFSGSLNYSYIKTSTPLPYAPEHKANLHLDYNFSRFTLSSDIQLISNLYVSPSLTEDYTTISLSASMSLLNNLSLFVKGSNLTDEKYYIEEGYPAPGRIFMSGIKLLFDGI